MEVGMDGKKRVMIEYENNNILVGIRLGREREIGSEPGVTYENHWLEREVFPLGLDQQRN
jgi:hypothetical protein